MEPQSLRPSAGNTQDSCLALRLVWLLLICFGIENPDVSSHPIALSDGSNSVGVATLILLQHDILTTYTPRNVPCTGASQRVPLCSSLLGGHLSYFNSNYLKREWVPEHLYLVII